MKRASYMQYHEEIQLGTSGLVVWGYGKNKKFVCRLEINATGIAVYGGTKGGKKLTNANWEQFVERLTKARRKKGEP